MIELCLLFGHSLLSSSLLVFDFVEYTGDFNQQILQKKWACSGGVLDGVSRGTTKPKFLSAANHLNKIDFTCSVMISLRSCPPGAE